MRAFKFEVLVGPDRTVRVQLPSEVCAGRAEVIVLAQDAGAEVELGGPDPLTTLLDELERNPWNRGETEMNETIDGERASWD